MANRPQSPKGPPQWSAEASAMAAHAKVLSGNKLEQLVLRLQRHSGNSSQACWNFIIQHGIKGRVDHRRWTESEFDFVREELVKRSIEEVAEKLKRTPEAIRCVLRRNSLSVRAIRCDLFSLESLATALHVRKSEIVVWIDRGWLPATVMERGKRHYYTITPEGLMHLYKHHQQDLLKRGMRNQSLFEAYVQYCYSPKHTVGQQLLDVRRDKRERAAFSAAQEQEAGEGSEDEEDDEDEDQAEHRLDREADRRAKEDSENEDE
jgi:hypothetical protein